jgi:hypothetical protein
MATCDFWSSRFNASAGNYQCPWCSRDLIPKMSNSAANPGKTFVSCAKDFGGCGLFSFLHQPPNEKFNPNKKQGFKRTKEDSENDVPRVGGSNIVGPIVSAPNATETRLADLAAEVAHLRSELKEVLSYIKEVNDQ